MRWAVLSLLLGWMWPAASAQAEIVMKILVVNPSETQVKEFTIHSPLPPEVRPEHVLDADGLKVEYDSQAQAYVLAGTVTLKPKESLSKRVVLEDVWVIPPERFSALGNETNELMQKLAGTPYEDRGRLLVQSIGRRLADIRGSQEQSIGNPEEHTVLEFAQLIKEMTGSKSKIAFKPLPVDDPHVRCPDITKARKELKWEPKVKLSDGLTKTIEWFKLNNKKQYF